MTWSAAQYSRFEAERNRPIVDLLAQLGPEPVRLAADLGCGPGNSTEFLAARYPSAEIVGIDSSADMIATARRRMPAIRFEIADIATWPESGPFDLILANASLQWVPDHAALLPALVGKLAKGGRLAVQVPDNLAEPSHRMMRAVAEDPAWSDRVLGATTTWDNRQSPEWYYRLLSETAGSVDLWRTTYHHRLPGGPAAIVEWFKGSALAPFLDPLDAAERSAFLARYLARIEEAYSVLPDGGVLLPFPRLFFVAVA